MPLRLKYLNLKKPSGGTMRRRIKGEQSPDLQLKMNATEQK